jgi:hypothetical protein
MSRDFQPQPRQIEAPGPEAPRAQDHWRVNLDEGWERHFWSREFGVSEEELRGAVAAVGNLAGSVRSYFQQARDPRAR